MHIATHLCVCVPHGAPYLTNTNICQRRCCLLSTVEKHSTYFHFSSSVCVCVWVSFFGQQLPPPHSKFLKRDEKCCQQQGVCVLKILAEYKC